MTPPPFKGGQGRSSEDIRVSTGVLIWVGFAAAVLAAFIALIVIGGKS